MPELPEVETVRRGIERRVKPGTFVSKIHLHRSDLREPLDDHAIHGVEGERVSRVLRRAKYLLIECERHTLISHLGMSGSWRWAEGDEALARTHDHVQIDFGESGSLIFNDPRRFSILAAVPRGQEKLWRGLKHLGPEPLGPEFNVDYLWGKTRGRKQAIKIAIMDQRIVVGVGNIYASEALFRAGVRPSRPAGRLRRTEAERIVDAVREVLQEAIDHGGSTIRDFVGTGGTAGHFQRRLFVYGREGDPCRRCGNTIRSKVMGGRSTYWCSQCQG